MSVWGQQWSWWSVIATELYWYLWLVVLPMLIGAVVMRLVFGESLGREIERNEAAGGNE